MRLTKGLALILILLFLLRGLVALGADAALDVLLQTAIGDENMVEAALLRQSSLLMATAQSHEQKRYPEPQAEEGAAEAGPEPEIQHRSEPSAQLPIYQSSRAEPISERLSERGRNQWSVSDIYLRNNTSFEIDVEALLASPLSFDPSAAGEPTVLILHTHGSESFEPDGDDWYENVDNFRTNDKNLNIIRVGAEVAQAFEARGIAVIHSREIHDYPSFRGSYGRSLQAAQRYLEAHPEIRIILDIHRDAIIDAAGNYVKTLATIEGVRSAQIMLVVGTNHAGLEHPHWRENLKFALRLQASMVGRYPGLARPLSLREERFNAHLAPGAVLVEIGACGNTLQEALTASRFFAEAAADVILGGPEGWYP